MKRSVVWLFLLAGCGAIPTSTFDEPEVEQPLVEDTSRSESSRDRLQEVVPIVVSETPVLAWGLFSGFPPHAVVQEGGEYQVYDFIRHSEGFYEVVYNVSTFEAGVIVALVSGPGYNLESGYNGLFIVGAIQVPDRTQLTVQVASVTNFVDLEIPYQLVEADVMFSLVLFGEP